MVVNDQRDGAVCGVCARITCVVGQPRKLVLHAWKAHGWNSLDWNGRDRNSRGLIDHDENVHD